MMFAQIVTASIGNGSAALRRRVHGRYGPGHESHNGVGEGVDAQLSSKSVARLARGTWWSRKRCGPPGGLDLQNQDRVLVLEVVVEICSGDETVFEAVEEVPAKRASIGPLNFPFGIVDDCPDLTVNQG